MKVLIVGLVKNNQFKRLQKEGNDMGVIVDGCFASELIIYSDNQVFAPKISDHNITEYSLIYLWAVGKRRWEWYTACYYLNKYFKTIIVNEKIISKDYNYFLSSSLDYLKQWENNLTFPRTYTVFSKREALSAVQKEKFPLVVKKSEGRQGRGVYLVKNKKELKRIVDEVLDQSPSAVIREFIPNDGDIRVFTIGYKAVAAMKRTPKMGDFRSNISQGGKGEFYDLSKSPEIKRIAEKISKITRTEIAGVDIMIHKETGVPYILEINPGPQFSGIEKYTGANIAREIIKYFLSLNLS